MRRRKYIGPLLRDKHFFSRCRGISDRRVGTKTRHQIIMKRSNLLKQACLMAMRESHPKEYNDILKQIVSLLPDGAVPRYVSAK